MASRKFKVPVNLVSLSSDPGSADEGDIYYNTTDDRIRVYKNSTWVNLAYADDVGITSTDYITFDTTPESTIPNTTGTMSWDSGEGSPTVVLDPVNGVNLNLGQENVALCYNGTGSTVTNGSVVYISGAQGQRPSITLADADSEMTSSKTFGIATQDIANGAEGFVTTFGIVNGVNTLGLTEGAALWLSSTAGGYTQTPPAEPAHLVFVGYCLKASETAGRIFVNPQNGYELTELHGVTIDGTPADNEVLAYDTSSGLWINQTSAEAGLIDTSSTAQTKTGNFTSSGSITAGAALASTQADGLEGGQIELAVAPSGTLSGTNVTIDVYENKLRIFESGGSNRGAYIDISGATSGVGSNLLAGGGSVSDSFKTISTPSGTSPVADSSTDTLTLTTDSYLTITGDATGDSIAFATGATSANTASKIVARDSNGDFSAGDITADQFLSTNNGNGTNFKVGDDAWIGDINLANTVSIQGQQNSANGYISFGTNDGTVLGRAGTGPLTYGTNTVVLGNNVTKISYQTTQPSSPATGDIWIDSDDSVVGYAGLPQVSTSVNLSLNESHNGKHIYTTVTGRTHTIPANSSVPLDIGSTFTFINPGSVTTTIAITSDTMYLSNFGTTGSRTLGPFGFATAVKITSTSWIISGNGLS